MERPADMRVGATLAQSLGILIAQEMKPNAPDYDARLVVTTSGGPFDWLERDSVPFVCFGEQAHNNSHVQKQTAIHLGTLNVFANLKRRTCLPYQVVT